MRFLLIGLVAVILAFGAVTPSYAADGDGDGVCDRGTTGLCTGNDLCPATPAGEPVDSNGCSAAQVDSDGDGVCNRGIKSDAWCSGADLCPRYPGPLSNRGCPVP